MKIKMIIYFFSALCVINSAQADRKRISKNIVIDNLPTAIKEEGELLLRHMKTTNSYSILGWNHSGKSLLFTYRNDLYQAKSREGKYRKVLDLKELSLSSAKKAKICGKQGYIFKDDKDNDEYSVVYAINKEQFEPIKLSKDRARNISLLVSNNKKNVSYASAQEGTGVWRLYTQEICEGSEPIEQYRGIEPRYPEDFHPKDTKLLFSGPDKDQFILSEVNLIDGKRQIIKKIKRKIHQANYSSDGNYIFYTTNSDSEFIELYRLERATGAVMRIFPNLGYDIEKIVLSENRNLMAVLINQDGLSKILVINADKLQLIAGPSKKSLGVISYMHFSPKGDQLALKLSQPTVPSRSGVYDYKKDSFIPWTGGFRNDQDIIEVIPELTQYPTFDSYQNKKRHIPMQVYRPAMASKNNPTPVIILAHGGPESQWRPSYSRLSHYYVSRLGLTVIRPNIRGSTGYGKSFELLDETLKRQDAIKDIGALLDWIEEQPELDSSKVIISGGSYGGYVSLASIAQYSDRFIGAVSRVGITDFNSFMKNTEPYRVNNRRAEYGDERKKDVALFFDKISPMKNVKNITKPVLIVQGANDPRVPQQQAEDMLQALKNNGSQPAYLLAMNEGHRFSKPENKKLRDGAQIVFIKRLLSSEKRALSGE